MHCGVKRHFLVVYSVERYETIKRFFFLQPMLFTSTQIDNFTINWAQYEKNGKTSQELHENSTKTLRTQTSNRFSFVNNQLFTLYGATNNSPAHTYCSDVLCASKHVDHSEPTESVVCATANISSRT